MLPTPRSVGCSHSTSTGGHVSREEAVDVYLEGRIDRRMFVRALVAAGVTVAAATTYSRVLAPERASGAPGPLGALDDYEGDGILRFVDRWGSAGSGHRQFMAPAGIAVDIARNRVYVTDSSLNKVKVFSQSGHFIDQWGRKGQGSGELKAPSGVTVDPTNGNVLVADTLNN